MPILQTMLVAQSELLAQAQIFGPRGKYDAAHRPLAHSSLPSQLAPSGLFVSVQAASIRINATVLTRRAYSTGTSAATNTSAPFTVGVPSVTPAIVGIGSFASAVPA